MKDTYNLDRFLRAQKSSYDTAYAEVSAGAKQSHWMWWIFPQIVGLGMTSTSVEYSIKSMAEAKAYLENPILGDRLRKISEVLLTIPENDASIVFGYPDDLKLCSSMTLFSQASPDEQVFKQVLDKFFAGKRDMRTIEILKNIGR